MVTNRMFNASGDRKGKNECHERQRTCSNMVDKK